MPIGVCTITSSGEVTTFDGASGLPNLQMPSGIKSLISKTNDVFGDLDPCKYQVRSVTDSSVSMQTQKHFDCNWMKKTSNTTIVETTSCWI